MALHFDFGSRDLVRQRTRDSDIKGQIRPRSELDFLSLVTKNPNERARHELLGITAKQQHGGTSRHDIQMVFDEKTAGFQGKFHFS